MREDAAQTGAPAQALRALPLRWSSGSVRGRAAARGKVQPLRRLGVALVRVLRGIRERQLGQATAAVDAIASGKESLKTLIFSGGSGWGPGQLEQEIDSGSWVLTDADRDLVISDDPSSFWQTAQARIRVDLEDNLYNGQTQRIIGTATATMMISSGSPTRQ